MKKEKLKMESVINPILKKYNLKQKEILEVCQIGKFVLKIDEEIKIIDKPQPPDPDFIIDFKGKSIGLEHTRLFSKDAARYLKIETLLRDAEYQFEKKYPENNVLASISIKDDKFDYKPKDKPTITREIADFVQWTRLGVQFKLPEFISRIETTDHTQVSFWFDEKKWQESEYLTRERLENEIRKKERRIEEYKKSKQILSEYWLVLMIGSNNSVTYKLNESENYEMDSLYDRVYLMTDYDADVIRVK